MKMEVAVKEKTKRSWRLNMTRVRAIAERLPNARPNVYKYNIGNKKLIERVVKDNK